MSYYIRNGHVLFSEGLLQTDLFIHEGVIKVPSAELLSQTSYKEIDAKGKYILPAFVDIHHHGANGFDCVWGGYDIEKNEFIHEQSIYEAYLEQALNYCKSKGIGRLFPTTMAAPKHQLLQSLRWLNDFLKKHPKWNHFIGGINLEGSFLKLPAYAGAQNPAYFYPPSIDFIDEVQETCGNRLKIVNLPPEHGQPGLNLIQELKDRGIVIAGGHSGANYHQFEQAVKAGLSLSVHFLNGPSKSSTKPFGGGGAVEAMLRLDEVMLELIVDGWHIHPAYVRDTIARKGIDNCIAITDSMFAGGLENLHSFCLAGIEGEVSKDGTYLQVANSADTLFGSILTPDKALENLLNWFTKPMKGVWYREHEAMSFQEALGCAVKMLSANPARLMSLSGIGEIVVGGAGEIVVVDILEGRVGFKVQVQML